MGFYYNLAVFGFVLFCSMQMGLGLKCYVCTSLLSPELCSDPVNNKSLSATVQECDSNRNGCMKQKLPAVAGIPESAHRACVPNDYCSGLNAQASTHCSICKTDYCNSAPKITPVFGGMILLTLLIRSFL